jgi:hypothetical protein
MKAEEFASHIAQVTRTRSHGRDEWYGECPNCRRPSLRFTDGKNGLIVGCSWAVSDLGRHGVMVDGCRPQTIAAALNWTLLDFLPPNSGRASSRSPRRWRAAGAAAGPPREGSGIRTVPGGPTRCRPTRRDHGSPCWSSRGRRLVPEPVKQIRHLRGRPAR